MVQTACERIGAFVESARFDGVFSEISRWVARAFVDTFAVAVAGRTESVSRIAAEYAVSGGGGPCTLWTTGERVRPEDAALANAATAHALDYDDVASPLRGHPSVVLIPALVALGEAEGADGRRISAAYAVGFEVSIKMAKAMGADHYTKGWHSTATIGVLGAAAGCAHLLGLDAGRAAAAVGLASAQAAGVHRSFGTMAKCIQPAGAAAAAIRSARLAAMGFTAAPDALEGRSGYVALYGNGEDVAPQMETLGSDPIELLRTGIDVKRYPCCYAAHRAIQGMLDLRADRAIDPLRVERVRVTVQPRGLAPLIHSRPRSGLEGKFSMEYSMAAALLDGAVRLSSFADEAVLRPEAQALLRKVETVEDQGQFFPRRALVEVELRSGESRSIQVEGLRGSAQLPLTDAELEEKLRDCVAFSGTVMDVDGFLRAAWSWDERAIGTVLRSAASRW